VFAACGSDDSSTFESATDQQLQRTMMAAMSLDTVLVGFTAAGYASAPEGGCPNVHIEGDRRTVTGGCTTGEGQEVEGSMTLENVPSLFGGGNDPSKPQLMEASDFRLTDENGPLGIDGKISATASTSNIDIHVDVLDIDVGTVAKYSCVEGVCTYEAATLDIEGIGQATLEGSFSFQNNTISLDLEGRDHLQLRSDGECLTYVAGSRSGKFCNMQ
jgi:hypothetical protein